MLCRHICALDGKVNGKCGLRVHPEPWSREIEREYHQRFSGAIERWLDGGHGACLLRRRECAELVVETLRHFEGVRLVIIPAAVMPNHVHALFVQNPEWPLEKLIRSWNGFTARRINALLGRSGSLWQRDYFDRLVRDGKLGKLRALCPKESGEGLSERQFIFCESELARSIA
jgi:putative transposase